MLFLLLSCIKVKPSLNIKGIQEDKLMEAAFQGDIDEVRKLIESGANYNHSAYDGNTVLTIAIKNDHIEVVKLLLALGVDVDKQNRDGMTAMMLVHEKMDKLPLERRAAYEQVYREIEKLIVGMLDSRLINAISENNLSQVNRLIDLGAKVNCYDKDGNTALILAIKNENLEIVKLLIIGSNINEPDKNGWTALMYASSIGCEEMFSLLKEQADLNKENKDGNTALMLASQHGHEGIVSILLKEQADVNKENKDGNTALMLAIQRGHEGIVSILLKSQADVNKENKDGNTALIIAVQNNNVQIVKILLEAYMENKSRHKQQKNREAKENFMKAFMLSVQNGCSDIVRVFLKAGVEVDEENSFGNTPLILAIQNGNKEIVSMLLKAGAKADKKNKDGIGAFRLAFISGQLELEMKNLLLAAGAYEFKGGKKESDLINATFCGNQAEVARLIFEGAIIDVKGEDGFTPLMLASQNGHEGIVNLLLEAKADIEAENIYGLTAIFLANKNGHQSIVNILLKAGALIRKKDQQFIDAILNLRSYSEIELIITQGADIGVEFEDGNYAIYKVIENGRADLVDLLLKQRKKVVNYINREGLTPLMLATLKADVESVRKLIANNAIVTIKDTRGNSALEISLTRLEDSIAKEEICLILLDRKRVDNLDKHSLLKLVYKAHNQRILSKFLDKIREDITFINDFLISLVQNQDISALQTIIRNNQYIEFNDSLLVLAVKKGNEELVETVLSKIEIIEENSEALLIAFDLRNKNIIERLLLKGAKLGFIAAKKILICLINESNMELIQILLDNIEDIDFRYNATPLVAAIKKDNIALVKDLLRRNVNYEISKDEILVLDNESTKLLHFLNLYSEKKVMDRYEILKLINRIKGDAILKDVVDINYRSNEYITPLMYSVIIGNYQLVTNLVERYFFHYQARDIRGLTALDYALEKIRIEDDVEESTKIAKFLVRLYKRKLFLNDDKDNFSKLAVHIKDIDLFKLIFEIVGEENQVKILMNACKLGNLPLVKKIFELNDKIDVDERDVFGNSPLMYASNLELFNYLLEIGAEYTKNKMGMNVLMMQAEANNEEIVKKIIVDRTINIYSKDNEGRTALIIAASNGNVECSSILTISQVDAVDNEYRTALMYASEICNKEIIEILIKEGIELDRNDKAGKTALMYATRKDGLECVKFLLDRGSDPFLVDYRGRNLLFYAIEADLDFYMEFIKLGLSIEVIDNDGVTLLMHAIKNNRLDIVEILIKDADISLKDKKGRTALLYAIEKNDQKILELLLELENNFDIVDQDGMTALMYACKVKESKLINFFVSMFDNLEYLEREDINGKTALLYAIENENIDAVETLLSKEIKIDTKDKSGMTPLMKACEKGNERIVKILISLGLEIRQRQIRNLDVRQRQIRNEVIQFTPLILASKQGHIGIVRLLCDAEVNEKDKDGCEPLIFACENGHIEIVKLLIECGASILKEKIVVHQELPPQMSSPFMDRRAQPPLNQVVDVIKDKTALICASKNGYIGIVKLLIEKGAEVNEKDKNGYTALVRASEQGHIEIVKLLIEKGAEVNEKDKNGYTALVRASEQGHIEIVKLLKNAGAKLNENWDNALKLASEQGHKRVVRLLLELDRERDRSNGILHSVKQVDNTISKLFIKNNPREFKFYPPQELMHIAIKNGHRETAKIILMNFYKQNNGHTYVNANSFYTKAVEYGDKKLIPLSYQNSEVLLASIRYGEVEILKQILSANRNLISETIYTKTEQNRGQKLIYNKFFLEALEKAISNGYTEVLKILFDVIVDKYIKDLIIIKASECGCISILKLCLSSFKDNINCKDNQGNSPLILATKNNHKATVKLLLEANAIVDQLDNRALMHVIERGDKLLIKLLIPLYFLANPKHIESVFYTVIQNRDESILKILLEFGYIAQQNLALIEASRIGNVKFVKLIAAAGIDIDFKNEHGNTALVHAFNYNHMDIAKILLDLGMIVDKNSIGSRELVLAIEKGSEEIVKLLLEKGVEINSADPLLSASSKGYVNILKILLDFATNIADEDMLKYRTEALISAIKKGHTEIVRLLLAKGVEIKSADPLVSASSLGHIDIVKMLLDYKTDTADEDMLKYRTKALIYAIQRGNVEIVRLFLEKGAEVNPQINFPNSNPLIAAIYAERVDILKMLLDFGAEINFKVSEYGTALISSVQKGNLELVQLLLNKGANPNSMSSSGETLLMIASSKGYVEIVKILLEFRVEINAIMRANQQHHVVNSVDRTALTFAIENNHPQVVRLLLERGAKANSQLLEIAISKQYFDIVEVLLEFGI